MAQGYARQNIFESSPPPTRADTSMVSSSLLDGAADSSLRPAIGKGGIVYVIQTDVAARVRLYADSASRTADLSRAIGSTPDVGAHLICEVITDGSVLAVLVCKPFCNAESPVVDTIPMTVTNLSGGTTTVTVTITAVSLEP